MVVCATPILHLRSSCYHVKFIHISSVQEMCYKCSDFKIKEHLWCLEQLKLLVDWTGLRSIKGFCPFKKCVLVLWHVSVKDLQTVTVKLVTETMSGRTDLMKDESREWISVFGSSSWRRWTAPSEFSSPHHIFLPLQLHWSSWCSGIDCLSRNVSRDKICDQRRINDSPEQSSYSAGDRRTLGHVLLGRRGRPGIPPCSSLYDHIIKGNISMQNDDITAGETVKK